LTGRRRKSVLPREYGLDLSQARWPQYRGELIGRDEACQPRSSAWGERTTGDMSETKEAAH